tara:strand:- start:187 stop:651 length:465 start_codon:yes stop_codon:yes gene_type:complete
MSSFWGTPTWVFLHTFAEKISDDFYIKNRTDIINIVRNICEGLPCPICKSHAMEYMRKVNEKTVPNKSTFISMFIHFHNTVNLRLGKKKFDLKNYDIYKKKNIKIVFNNFKNTYGKQYTSILSRTAGEYYREQQRFSLCKSLFKWLNTNQWHFR